MGKPVFLIKKNSQKIQDHFKKILTRDMLTEICVCITGKRDFICRFKDNAYGDEYFTEGKWNEGRLLILKYDNSVAYIALSMPDIDKKKGGRNSAVESVGVLYNKFYFDRNPNKKLFYYFVGKKGLSTQYLNFNYRIFKTIGFNFINDKEVLGGMVSAFSTVEDVIAAKSLITQNARNRTNNPTFIVLDENNKVQIYGKTFGAHKYESSMLCYALAMISRNSEVELYEISDNGLSALPQPSQEVIKSLGNVQTRSTSVTLEKNDFDKKESLRSPIYIYNLLNTLGQKRCALCGCVVHQLIQGAHIWPVASIKKRSDLTFDEKFEFATNGKNGLWMCENHHKLFDANLLLLKKTGDIEIVKSLNDEEKTFITKITECTKLPSNLMSDNFEFYVEKRYS